MKRAYILLLVLALLGAVVWYFWQNTQAETPPEETKKTDTEKDENTKKSFNKSLYSTEDPNSLWVVVNKRRPLKPASYRPADLVVPNIRLRVPGHETMQMRASTAKALESMFAAAKADGIELMLSSAFRSYEYQKNLYNGYVNTQGQAEADKVSARPGYSEHQTGLAVDVRPINGECELEICFGTMIEGKWVAANAYKYGFIIRYTKTNRSIAGYTYEPWHIRFVGKPLAREYKKQNSASLETFFGLAPAPDYL
jgi:D-alanyl-D-alanine carboxypeptidase